MFGQSVQAKAGLGALAVALFVADVHLPRHGFGVPQMLFALIGAALVLDAVRAHRPASTLPWHVLCASLLLPAVAMVVQNAMGRPALDLPPVAHGLVVAGMVCSIVAFGLYVRARTRVLDRYQLLDLAIVVISAALAISELVLEPLMDAHPPEGISRGLSTIYILMVLVTLVLAARFLTLPGRRGFAVWCLAGVTVGLIVASMVTNATATAEGGGLRVASTLMLAIVLSTVAARHPSMLVLTEPATGEPPSFGAVRLVGLGLALFLTPLTAVLVFARTGQVNAVTILVPGAVVTALVMARLRLVLTREESSRAEVEASHQAFSALIQGISDVIMVVDPRGVILYASDSAVKALGTRADELTGLRLPDLVHAADAAEVEHALADLPGSGRTVDCTVRIPVDGDERVFELEASDRIDNVSLRGIVAVLHDVTDRHLLEGELRHQASHDVLTGLPNRKLLVERVRVALGAAADTHVLFVDLDDFKDVNDGLGHHAGDMLLCAVAGRLERACRDGDTVARLGGDEFAILVVDDDIGGAGARRVARNVLGALEQPFELGGQRISIGASIGVASGVGMDDDQELLRHADVAMYRAKAAGKGTLAVFEPGMDDLTSERLCLHVDLSDPVGASARRGVA